MTRGSLLMHHPGRGGSVYVCRGNLEDFPDRGGFGWRRGGLGRGERLIICQAGFCRLLMRRVMGVSPCEGG